MQDNSKRRVMVACVTFETVKITDPIFEYNSNVVHLLHYVREGEENAIYAEFYDRVVEMIAETAPKTQIVEHVVQVYNFQDTMGIILNILGSETEKKASEILVNISAGTCEYISAASLASMMYGNVQPITVHTNEYTVSNQDLRNIYYEDGKPVGLTKSVRRIDKMTKYDSVCLPSENLIRGLRILYDMNNDNTISISSSDIVGVLKSNGLWGDHKQSDDEEIMKRNDAVYYHRDFVTLWKKYGWVKSHDLHRNRLIVTEEGKHIIDTFFIDDVKVNSIEKVYSYMAAQKPQ